MNLNIITNELIYIGFESGSIIDGKSETIAYCFLFVSISFSVDVPQRARLLLPNSPTILLKCCHPACGH